MNRSFIKPDRSWLFVIISIATLLRLGAAFYFGDQVVVLPGTSDQLSYDMVSQRVLAGHGFTVSEPWWPATRAGAPTAHWSYLYTLYLVVIYGVFGYHPLIARVTQAVLAGFLMPWFGYRLGCRHFNHKVGLVTAGLMAVYAYFIYYSATLMTETFYIIAILWTLDIAGRLGEINANNGATSSGWKQNLLPALMLGLSLSVTVLFRQVFLLFIPVLFVWLLWRSYQARSQKVWSMIAILTGATAILVLSILPWTMRNYRAFNNFVLLNTNAGFAFYWGNHPIHGYNFISILPESGPSYLDLLPPELADLDEAGLDRTLLKRGLSFVAADPIRYVILSGSRVKDYFKFWPSPDSGILSNVLRLFSFGLLWPFMLYGLIAHFRESIRTETLLLYLFIAAYTAVHLLTWALIRYRLPVDAILLIFASTSLVALYARMTQYLAAPKQKPDPVHFH